MSIPRVRLHVFLVLLAVLFAVQTAKADPVILINGGAAVNFTYQPTGFPLSHGEASFSLSGNVLTVVLSNTGTEVGGDGGSLIDAIGFNTTPNVTVNSLIQSGDVSGWILNQGPLGVFEVSSADGPGGGQGDLLAQGESTTLVFTFAALAGNLSIDLTEIHIQSLGTGDGGSQKPPGNPPGDDPPGDDPPEVPEPTTMLLLGSGLTGLAGLIRKRRRKLNLQ